VTARATWWRDQFGDRPLSELNGDIGREGISRLSEGTASQGGVKVTGTDRKLTPATLNRYQTAISTVF
jgi:hypothetical protein